MSNDEMNAAPLSQLSDLYPSMEGIEPAAEYTRLTGTETLHTLTHPNSTPATTSATPRELGAIYAHANRWPQAQDSLDAQTEACLRYAENAGISVPAKWRFAEMVSGRAVRPGYQKVMKLARSGQIHHIIAFWPDRLNRDVGVLIADLQDLERLSVRVHTPLGEIPREMISIIGVVNEVYNHNLSKRSRNRKP